MRSFSRWFIRFLPFTLLWALAFARTVVLAQQAAPPPQDTRSVWSGVYTEAQSNRGAEVYKDACARCHGKALEGGDGSPLSGKDFMSNRDGTTLDALFRRILDTMPDDDPGTLKPPQASDVVAYILNTCKFPTGDTELPTDPALLKQIRFEATKPK